MMLNATISADGSTIVSASSFGQARSRVAACSAMYRALAIYHQLMPPSLYESGGLGSLGRADDDCSHDKRLSSRALVMMPADDADFDAPDAGYMEVAHAAQMRQRRRRCRLHFGRRPRPRFYGRYHSPTRWRLAGFSPPLSFILAAR